MAPTWRAPAVFVSVLATALAVGWGIHVRNRDRRISEFQDHQLHTITTVAAVVQAGLNGSARSLRVLAAASTELSDRSLAALLEDESHLGAPPRPFAITVYRADGTPWQSARRLVALDASQVTAAAAWARDPANAARLRSTIGRSAAPALVLMVPRIGHDARTGAPTGPDGFVAEELPFDSLFEGAQSGGGPPSPDALLVVSGAGDVLYRSGHPEMRLNNLFSRGARCAQCHESLAHVDTMMAMKHGVLQYAVRGTPRLAAIAPVSFEGDTWMAAAMAPASRAVALVTSELQQLGMVTLVTLLGLGLAMRMASRDRQARLEAAAEASRKVDMQRSHAALTALNARLESAADEWRMTVDTIDAAIVVLDPAGAIERMNRVASDLLPGPPFSWIGQPSAGLASTQPWPSALILASEAIERDGVSMARVRDPVTGTTWDLWCRAPRRPQHRRSVVVVARDVSALVELQASVRRSETMAALGLVVAGVAHEVRNPLFAISSLVDAWALQGLGAPARLVGALRTEVGRLKTLMTELLEYGSPSTSELTPRRLAPVVDEALKACRHESEAREVCIEATVPADLEIWMDAKRLIRVFINLLQNAVQHAPRDSTVTLIVLRPGPDDAPRAEIVVRDEGSGVAAEDLPRLFTPFFSRRAGGFGLGLAISERIVGEHGGLLSAANHPEGGAVFTVELPLGPPHPLLRVSEGAELC